MSPGGAPRSALPTPAEIWAIYDATEARLTAPLGAETQAAWASDRVEAAAPLWRNGVIRLESVTRIVVASSSRRR